jgi:hypothetical protein
MIHEGIVRSRSADIVVERLKNVLNITEDEPYLTSRRERYRVFRQTAMYIIRNNVGLTYAETARIFNKDHATAINACNMVKNQLSLANKIGFMKYSENALKSEHSKKAFDFLVNYDDKPYAALLGDLDSVEAQIRELYGIRRRIKQKLNNNQIYF